MNKLKKTKKKKQCNYIIKIKWNSTDIIHYKFWFNNLFSKLFLQVVNNFRNLFPIKRNNLENRVLIKNL